MADITNFDIKLIEVHKVLDEYAKRFEELVKVNLQKNDKKASGDLLASIKVRVQDPTTGFIYTVILDSKKYLEYIEYGSKPHWPPTEPILKWVKDKKLPTKELYGGNLPTEKQLTYLVKRKIATKGIDAVPIVATTAKELNQIYLPKLEEALQMDIVNSLPIIKIVLNFDI